MMQVTEDMIVDGPSELLSDGSKKDRGEIKNEINSTTERINQYLVQMVETKQTRQRLADLLKEASDFEMNLKSQIKAEIEKGNGLKEELKSVTEGVVDEEVGQDNLDTTDVEKFLEQLDNESKMNCLFVECISTGPSDEGDYGTGSHFLVPEMSSFMNQNMFMEPTSQKRKSVKKQFDDITYEPRTVTKGKKIGKRGRKRGSYKKKLIDVNDETNVLLSEMTGALKNEENDAEYEGTYGEGRPYSISCRSVSTNINVAFTVRHYNISQIFCFLFCQDLPLKKN